MATLGDVDFVNELAGRCDWTKLADDAPAPLSVGEFRRCVMMLVVEIQANIGIVDDLKRTCAMLGIGELAGIGAGVAPTVR